LRTLDFSLRSFSHSDPLFSITSALFSQNTGGVGAPALPRHASLPPSHAPRGASIPCALTRLRILPVTTGVYPKASLFCARCRCVSVGEIRGFPAFRLSEGQTFLLLVQCWHFRLAPARSVNRGVWREC
jgi:hypothetical protein